MLKINWIKIKKSFQNFKKFRNKLCKVRIITKNWPNLWKKFRNPKKSKNLITLINYLCLKSKWKNIWKSNKNRVLFLHLGNSKILIKLRSLCPKLKLYLICRSKWIKTSRNQNRRFWFQHLYKLLLNLV